MSRTRSPFLAAALGAVLAACGGGGLGFDDATRVEGAQGTSGSSLIRRNAGVLVDPAGRSAWLPHEGSWVAVSTSSGVVTPVLSLYGQSDLRVAFLTDDLAVVITADPEGCPFQTSACTRVTPVDTVTATAGAPQWEGSTLDFSIQSPTKRFVALSGGFATSGVYLVDPTGDLRPIHWESIAGGTGWSRCHDGSCEERLWMVGRGAIYSWKVFGGALEDEPDLAFPAECSATYQVSTPDGPRPEPLVVASESGRWVAITCDGRILLFDAASGQLEDTGLPRPVAFAGETMIGNFPPPEDEEDDDGGYPDEWVSCLQFGAPSDLVHPETVCVPGLGYTFYVTDAGWLVASDEDSIVVPLVTGFEPEVASIEGLSLLDGKFVERLGYDEIWLLSAGHVLHAFALDGIAVTPIPLSLTVSDLSILPSQDELVLRSSEAVTFYSMVTGSAATIGLP